MIKVGEAVRVESDTEEPEYGESTDPLLPLVTVEVTPLLVPFVFVTEML